MWSFVKFVLLVGCFFVLHPPQDFFTHLKNDNTCITVTKKDVAIGSERTSDLTYMYARHLWPLSSKGSLGCPAYCDMGVQFSGHHQGPVTFSLIVWQWNCLRSDLSVMLYQLRYCSGA